MSAQAQIQTPGSLLLPLDGSRAADCAVPFARDLALRCGAPVTVLHVFSAIGPLVKASENNVEWTEKAEPRAEIRPPASIRSAVEDLQLAGVRTTIIGRLGDVAEQIATEAGQMHQPWVVMASLGATGFRRILLGTNALNVVRNSRFPVLVIPASSTTPAGFDSASERIAVLLDGTPDAEVAVAVACGVAQSLDSELDVVRVAETMDDTREREDALSSDDDLLRSMERDVAAYVDRLRSECQEMGIRSRSMPLSGSPASQIQRYVADMAPAMVVLVTRRRSGIERWTYGSFAEHLVDALPTPTLLIPVES